MHAGPFNVLERIGRAAYRVDFPPQWRIHAVIFVDHLEPYLMDPYGRLLPDIGPVRTEDHEANVVGHRKTKTGDHWLLRFGGLGPEIDEWRATEKLGRKAQTLINSFLNSSH